MYDIFPEADGYRSRSQSYVPYAQSGQVSYPSRAAYLAAREALEKEGKFVTFPRYGKHLTDEEWEKEVARNPYLEEAPLPPAQRQAHEYPTDGQYRVGLDLVTLENGHVYFMEKDLGIAPKSYKELKALCSQPVSWSFF